MKRVPVREQQAGEAVYPGPVQILTDDPLVSPLVTTVEQPVRASSLQVNGSSRADIEDGNLCDELFGPMRMFHVKMPPGTCASNCTLPMTSCAKSQLALLKITATPGRNGAERRERSAIARMKKAIGTTIKFATKEIGVTI